MGYDNSINFREIQNHLPGSQSTHALHMHQEQLF